MSFLKMYCVHCKGVMVASGEKDILNCPYCGALFVVRQAVKDYQLNVGSTLDAQLQYCLNLPKSNDESQRKIEYAVIEQQPIITPIVKPEEKYSNSEIVHDMSQIDEISQNDEIIESDNEIEMPQSTIQTEVENIQFEANENEKIQATEIEQTELTKEAESLEKLEESDAKLFECEQKSTQEEQKIEVADEINANIEHIENEQLEKENFESVVLENEETQINAEKLSQISNQVNNESDGYTEEQLEEMTKPNNEKLSEVNEIEERQVQSTEEVEKQAQPEAVTPVEDMKEEKADYGEFVDPFVTQTSFQEQVKELYFKAHPEGFSEPIVEKEPEPKVVEEPKVIQMPVRQPKNEFTIVNGILEAYNGDGETATIPDDVVKINVSAFFSCKNLKNIFIGKNVQYISDGAFVHCTSIEKIVIDRGNLNYRSNGNAIIDARQKMLIFGCKNTIIPTDGSVLRIGAGAFADCVGLLNMRIPEGITFIGNSAFKNCINLTQVNIPASASYIAVNAFEKTGLLDVSVSGGGLKKCLRCGAEMPYGSNTCFCGCKYTIK